MLQAIPPTIASTTSNPRACIRLYQMTPQIRSQSLPLGMFTPNVLLSAGSHRREWRTLKGPKLRLHRLLWQTLPCTEWDWSLGLVFRHTRRPSWHRAALFLVGGSPSPRTIV